MKKLFLRALSLIMAVLMLSALSACGETEEKPKGKSEKERLKILATVFPPYDFARQITKDLAEVEMLLSPGSDSHSYEPTLEDIAKIADCDIFIYTGGESEKTIAKILKTTDMRGKRVISMLSLVEPVYIENEHNHSGDIIPPDDHIWTSPKNAERIVKEINSAVAELAPQYEVEFNKNTLSYLEELSKLDSLLESLAESAGDEPLIFADRFPFAYLAEEYSFAYLSALNGCSSDTEPTLTAIDELVKAVRKYDAKAVFFIENSTGGIAEQISSITGVKPLLLHSCHTLSEDEIKGGETYLSLMQKNIENIRKAVCS